MSTFNYSDLELLCNKKKLGKFFDKEKVEDSVKIEQILNQINNISKNDQKMALNLDLNAEVKKEMETIIQSYNNLNQLIKDIKLSDGRYFIENLIDEILNDAVSKSKSIDLDENKKLIKLNLK